MPRLHAHINELIADRTQRKQCCLAQSPPPFSPVSCCLISLCNTSPSGLHNCSKGWRIKLIGQLTQQQFCRCPAQGGRQEGGQQRDRVCKRSRSLSQSQSWPAHSAHKRVLVNSWLLQDGWQHVHTVANILAHMPAANYVILLIRQELGCACKPCFSLVLHVQGHSSSSLHTRRMRQQMADMHIHLCTYIYPSNIRQRLAAVHWCRQCQWLHCIITPRSFACRPVQHAPSAAVNPPAEP